MELRQKAGAVAKTTMGVFPHSLKNSCICKTPGLSSANPKGKPILSYFAANAITVRYSAWKTILAGNGIVLNCSTASDFLKPCKNFPSDEAVNVSVLKTAWHLSSRWLSFWKANFLCWEDSLSWKEPRLRTQECRQHCETWITLNTSALLQRGVWLVMAKEESHHES